MEDLWVYIILAVPVMLFAIPAAYWLLTRRKATRPVTKGRSDATERREFTGPEQHKHRKLP